MRSGFLYMSPFVPFSPPKEFFSQWRRNEYSYDVFIDPLTP